MKLCKYWESAAKGYTCALKYSSKKTVRCKGNRENCCIKAKDYHNLNPEKLTTQERIWYLLWMNQHPQKKKKRKRVLK